MKIKYETLAIHGGEMLRPTPLPYRRLFGEAELAMVTEVFENSWRQGKDFGFEGEYERRYTDAFCRFQGGQGFADGVSSGSAAVYLAIKALDIPAGSEVIVSPATNPGGVAPAVIQGMKIVVADSLPNSFLIDPDAFARAITPATKAAILTHSGGTPLDMDPIMEIAQAHSIPVIEDCSQAHGALYKGKRVGRFGAVAAFSTMFSKNHSTGGCGGLVYTENEELYWRIRSHADRGKPFNDPDFDPRRFHEYRFPALNFNLDELSCAIGLSTLRRLPTIIEQRNEIVAKLDASLAGSAVVSPAPKPCYPVVPSPFFYTARVDVGRLRVPKRAFAEAVAAEGIWINPDYREIVSEWKWLNSHFAAPPETPNARAFRDATFNILFNEQFTDRDIEDIVACIRKVEDVLAP